MLLPGDKRKLSPDPTQTSSAQALTEPKPSLLLMTCFRFKKSVEKRVYVWFPTAKAGAVEELVILWSLLSSSAAVSTALRTG